MEIKLLHFALLSEAIYFIEKFKAKKINSNPKIFKAKNYLILIGGVGEQNTKTSLEYIFKNYKIKKAYNIGIAGCNKKTVKLGEVFINFNNLTTQNTPVFNKNSKNLELFDMEAAFFKEICLKYLNEQNLKIIKVVSDFLDKEKLQKDFVKSLFVKNFKKILEEIDD